MGRCGVYYKILKGWEQECDEDYAKEIGVVEVRNHYEDDLYRIGILE